MTYNDNLAYTDKSNPLQVGKAINVEALLVWTYRHQRAHAVSEHGVSLERAEAALDASGAPRLAMSNNGAALAAAADDPSRIPGNAYAYRCEVLPRDAALVHGVVESLPSAARSLVVRHASAA